MNESIDYDLFYGPVKIGVAHLDFGYNPACPSVYITAEAYSTGLAKLFKNVFFSYECCMNAKTGLPIYDSRILTQGDYSEANTVYYNHSYRKDSTLVYSKLTDSVLVPKNIFDILTGFFHYRTNYFPADLSAPYNASIKTFFIEKVWDLNIRYYGTETIDTKYGHIECFKIKPKTVEGYFFGSSDAMTIWVTKKGRHVPLKFSIDLKIGTLYGEITDYQKPGKK